MAKIYLKDNEAVNCRNHISALSVLMIAHHCGGKWYSGLSFIKESFWNKFQHETCYVLHYGGYCSIDIAIENDFNIISSEEFLLRQSSHSFEIDP